MRSLLLAGRPARGQLLVRLQPFGNQAARQPPADAPVSLLRAAEPFVRSEKTRTETHRLA